MWFGLHQLSKHKEVNDDWISQKLIYLCKKKLLLSFFRFRVDDKSGIFQVNTYLPDGWTYVVLNYYGPNEGQGISVYYNSNIQLRHFQDRTKQQSNLIPSGNGHVTIGNRLIYGYHQWQYASLKLDELTFWNRILSLIEIEAILDMTVQV